MKLKLLEITPDFPDLATLYAINDEAFPADERIPNPQLLDILAQYGGKAYAFYDGADMVGFATVMYRAELKMGYIWYFAIEQTRRDKGYGSACMKRLIENFPQDAQLVLDMEQVVSRPEIPNYEQRTRRLTFYERNGYTRTRVAITYFGMHLELMCHPAPFRRADFEKLLDLMRNNIFNPRLYPLE